MKRPLLFLLGVWILGECAALWMGISLHPQTPLDTRMKGRENARIRVSGVVEQIRPASSGISYILEDAVAVLEGETCKTRKVLVFSDSEEQLAIGIRVEAAGLLSEFERARNPGGFDYRAYYQALDIDYRLKESGRRILGGRENRVLQFLTDLRKKLTESLEGVAGEEDAALMEAMILGDRSGLTSALRREYQEASLSHLLSISGLHISLLAMGLEKILRRAGLPGFPRRLLCGAAALSYVWLCGGSAGAKRAGIMFLLYLGAQAAGRTYDSLSALAAAALLLLAGHPLLLFQNGFQLSVLAVFGTAGLWPVMRKWAGMRSGLGVSLSIQWMTWPVTASMNGMIPALGLFLNLLALPPAGALLLFAGVSACLGLVSREAASWTALPARLVLAWYRFLTETAGKIPGQGFVTGCPEYWQIAGYYFLLGGFLWWMRRRSREGGFRRDRGKKRREGRRRPGRILMVLGMSLVFPCLLRRLPPAGVQVCCIDVGQGDSILVRSAEFSLLIDGGSSQKEEVGEEILLPALRSQGISRLEAVIATHGDADHINGLAALFSDNNLQIGVLLLSRAEAEDGALAPLVRQAGASGTPVRLLRAGDRWTWGGARFSCLYPGEEETENSVPEDRNNASLVLRLDAEGISFLFTGDLGAEGEEALLARGAPLDVNILKAGHHGSRHSSTEAFLAAVSPDLTLISCGRGNLYGHPHGETLTRLSEAGSAWLTTAEGGALTVEARAGRYRVWRYLTDQSEETRRSAIR